MTRTVLGVAGCVALAIACLIATSATATGMQPQAQDPLAGARVFGDKGCARCHAIDGVGGGVGPDLAKRSRPRSFYDLASALWNHLPRMADEMRRRGIARPELSADEASNLIAYLYTLRYFDQPGDPVIGERVFAGKRCVQCHQLNGAGGVVGPTLDFVRDVVSPIYVASALWNHAPTMATFMRKQGIQRPTFTGTELRHLIAYLAPERTPPGGSPVYVLPGRAADGRRLFTEKKCSRCHGPDARGGVGTPDLAGRADYVDLIELAAALWNKAPRMLDAMKNRKVQVPVLRPEEMSDIVAYLYEIRYMADRGTVSRGMQVAERGGCTACHADTARPGKARRFAEAQNVKSPAGVVAALWNHTVSLNAGGQRLVWPMLQPQDVADLSAMLASVSRRP